MQGFALVNYVCTAVDPNCSDFDNIQNVCRQCRNGMTAEGPKCVWLMKHFLYILYQYYHNIMS